MFNMEAYVDWLSSFQPQVDTLGTAALVPLVAPCLKQRSWEVTKLVTPIYISSASVCIIPRLYIKWMLQNWGKISYCHVEKRCHLGSRVCTVVVVKHRSQLKKEKKKKWRTNISLRIPTTLDFILACSCNLRELVHNSPPRSSVYMHTWEIKPSDRKPDRSHVVQGSRGKNMHTCFILHDCRHVNADML